MAYLLLRYTLKHDVTPAELNAGCARRISLLCVACSTSKHLIRSGPLAC
jgi:hypothetical protein